LLKIEVHERVVFETDLKEVFESIFRLILVAKIGWCTVPILDSEGSPASAAMMSRESSRQKYPPAKIAGD